MYRLLIVDDEPYTVDGLYEMLLEVFDWELDVYKAYSPEEAMEWLVRTKIDIVLSDIRMPGMSGLELQQWVREQWPRCRIIFLTGMRDIQTAQQAIRGGTVNYILKTEGDEEIVRSIRQAIEQLSEEHFSDQLITKAKDQLRRALPLLQREWFLGLIKAGTDGRYLQASRLRELEIDLNPEAELFPVVGRIDQWRESDSSADQTLLLYAIQNIASEYMETVQLFSVILDGSHFVWLIQLKGSAETGDTLEIRWRKAVSFVQGTLETVQQTCRTLLNLPVSFISWKFSARWEELPEVYDRMRKTLVLGLGNGREMLLTAYYEMSIEDSGYEAHDRPEGVVQIRGQVQDERTNRLVAKLHQYIQDHLSSNLSLTVLAESVYLNPSYLSVLYKQHTGRNLSEYISEIRLAKAKELLMSSHLKIHEVAEQVGFETAGYFTRFFKKHTGWKPQEFRNR